jgi:hypothetical protein
MGDHDGYIESLVISTHSARACKPYVKFIGTTANPNWLAEIIQFAKAWYKVQNNQNCLLDNRNPDVAYNNKFRIELEFAMAMFYDYNDFVTCHHALLKSA